MTVHTARRDGVEIAYETFGSDAGEPLLLVMGMGGQMLAWHPEFCPRLRTLLRLVKIVKRPVTDAESFTRQMLELHERGYDRHAIQRQTAAIAAAGDRRAALSALDVPTLVIHGEADQIIRPPASRENRELHSGREVRRHPRHGSRPTPASVADHRR